MALFWFGICKEKGVYDKLVSKEEILMRFRNLLTQIAMAACGLLMACSLSFI